MLVAESINGSHPTSSTFCILQNFSGSPPESCEAPLLVIPTSQPASEVRFQHMTVSIPMPTLPKAAHVKSHSYTLQSLTPKAYRRLLRPRVTAGFAFIPCRTVEGVSRNMPGHSNHCWVWALYSWQRLQQGTRHIRNAGVQNVTTRHDAEAADSVARLLQHRSNHEAAILQLFWL